MLLVSDLAFLNLWYFSLFCIVFRIQYNFSTPLNVKECVVHLLCFRGLTYLCRHDKNIQICQDPKTSRNRTRSCFKRRFRMVVRVCILNTISDDMKLRCLTKTATPFYTLRAQWLESLNTRLPTTARRRVLISTCGSIPGISVYFTNSKLCCSMLLKLDFSKSPII